MLTHLSLDIQIEIIKWLPVKSLIRFRSVCKAWKSFIDSSQFIAGYSHTHPQHLLIKYQVRDWEETREVKCVCFVDDDDTFPKQKFAPNVPSLLQLLDQSPITGSYSSGGLLFLNVFLREPDNSITDLIVLWNPTIRKSIAVELPNVANRKYDPVVGFGVRPYTNDPKLVRITYVDDVYWTMESIPHQVMVFTLSSKEWTCLPSNQQLPRKSIQFTSSSTVIGQFIYWYAYDWIDVVDKPRNLIMSFDMSSEEFGEIDLPDCLSDMRMSVSRLRDSLVLLEYNINFTTNKYVCDVWMMEHGDSKVFTKLFTINPSNASVFRTVGFRKNGEPILEMHDDDDQEFVTPSALVVYEACSEHVKDLGICGDRFSVYSYTESLLLLDHVDGHIVRCGAVKK